MAATLGKASAWALAGTMVAGGPVMAACSSGPTYDQWASTDGAAGRMNLDDVQEAFRNSKSATDFEQRVNQIYEGDGLVLVRAKQEADGLVLEGWEDLDGNYEISDTQDDLLFSIFERSGQHEMRGYGANSYYHNSFGAGNFLFTYLLISAVVPRGGYYYTTPPTYARTTMTGQRDSYRNSSRYRSQVSRNSNYFETQKRFAGSRYDSAGRNLSTSRQSYMNRQQSSGAFTKSSTGVRSSWGRSAGASRSSGFGGRGGFFRGGGGSQTLIGLDRFAPPG